MPFIVVHLKTLEILKQDRINRVKYSELIEKSGAKSILIFSQGSGMNKMT